MDYIEIFKKKQYTTPIGVDYKKAYEDLRKKDPSLSPTILNLLYFVESGNSNLVKMFLENRIGYKLRGGKIGALPNDKLFQEILEIGLLCKSPVKTTSVVFEKFDPENVTEIVKDYIKCISLPNFRYILTLVQSKIKKLYLYELCIQNSRLDLLPEIKGLSAHKMNYIRQKYKNTNNPDKKLLSFLNEQLKLKSRKKSSISTPVSLLRRSFKKSLN